MRLTTSGPAARRWKVIASGLLLLALAVIVIYTGPNAFLSPIALVVVAAIGLAALLLQLRFPRRSLRDVGVGCGLRSGVAPHSGFSLVCRGCMFRGKRISDFAGASSAAKVRAIGVVS